MTMVMAIERSGSLDSDVLLKELTNGSFTSFFSDVSFDANGQNTAAVNLLQYTEGLSVETTPLPPYNSKPTP